MLAPLFLILAAVSMPVSGKPQKGPTLPWVNSKDLARLKDPATPLEERKTLAHDIAARAEKRDECLELAQEYLQLATLPSMDDGLASECMLALRGCSTLKVRAYFLRELGQTTVAEKIKRILYAAAGWKDPKLDELASREYLKDPSGYAGSWWRWFLLSEHYGAIVPRLVERIDDPKEQDEETLLEFVSLGQSLTRGTGQYATWKPAALRWTADPRDVVRRSAARFVYEHIEDSDLQACLAAARHPDAFTRRWAIEALGKLRSPAAVAGLIETLSREAPDSRVGAGCARILCRLTQQGFGRDAVAWKQWWSAAKEKLPPAPAEGAPVVDDGVTDPVFLGTEVSSNRILIVLDLDHVLLRAREDSAAAQRVADVRGAIEAYVQGLADSSAVNVLVARAKPVAWKPSSTAELPPEGRKARAANAPKKEGEPTARERELELLRVFLDQQLGAEVPAQEPEKKSLWPTFEAAWAETEADTLLFVSDGHGLVPTGEDASKPDPKESSLADWARDLDRYRHVRVHTFVLGGEVPRLRKLAEERMGVYRRLP